MSKKHKNWVYQHLGASPKCQQQYSVVLVSQGVGADLLIFVFSPGVYQLLGVRQQLGVAPKYWQTLFYVFFTVSSISVFVTEKVVKMLKKIILTSKQHAKYPFAGQNTQHKSYISKSIKYFCSALGGWISGVHNRKKFLAHWNHLGRIITCKSGIQLALVRYAKLY